MTGSSSTSRWSTPAYLAVVLFACLMSTTTAFMVAGVPATSSRISSCGVTTQQHHQPLGSMRNQPLCMTSKQEKQDESTTTATTSALPDIATMKARELKQELQSYGISTKSLLEKKDLQQAVEQARKEGKKPMEPKKEQEEATTASSSTSAKEKDPSSANKESRQERYDQALQEAQGMKVKELKQALQDRGISTKSFFEKSEFVKAYAEAVADNKTGGGSNKSSSKAKKEEEVYDPEYRDVTMMKFDLRQIRGQSVIDIKLGR